MPVYEELTDAEDELIEDHLADPTKIETHDRCDELIDILDNECAGIESQLEVARIEGAYSPLSEAKQSWIHRAAYALAMKRNQKHRIMQRDREIRLGFKFGDEHKKKKDPGEGLVKQERLKAEVEIRKLQKMAENQATHAKHQERMAEFSARKRITNHFAQIANERLDRTLYDEIMEEAKRRAAAAV